MRLREHIEEYNIDSLESISETTSCLVAHCKNLEEYGDFIRAKLKLSSDEFTSVNYSKIESILNNYLAKLKNFESEMEELNSSVNSFVEKMEIDIWGHKWSD